MIPIVSTSLKKVTSLFLPLPHNGLYNKLSDILNAAQLSFFAYPENSRDSIQWYSKVPGNYKTSDIKDFSQLNEEDQLEVLENIEKLKSQISTLLARAFVKDISQFFVIPSPGDIKVIETKDGLYPILTQWGYKSNEALSTIDPITHLLNERKINNDEVIIDIKYTDGSKAANKKFFITYRRLDIEHYTSDEGLYSRGYCLLNSRFYVFDLVNGEKKYEHEFTVIKGGKYVVIFPFLTDVSINVIDQKNNVLPGCPVSVLYNGAETRHISNNTANILIEGLEAGKEIIVGEEGNKDNVQKYVIQKTGNDLILKVFRPEFADAIIKVVDEKDVPQINYPVIVEFNGKKTDYITDESGLIKLMHLEVGKPITIINKKKAENFFTYEIAPGTNEFIFKLVYKLINIKLIDHKYRPIPAIPIDFSSVAGSETQITDDNGICRLPVEFFTDKEKIKALIHQPKKSRKDSNKEKKKEKLINKSFVYKTTQTEYVIKLRRYRWLWWLLLLLIPLLLLIRLEKTVYIKTVDAESNLPVSSSFVTFGYNQAFLYDRGRFFTNDAVHPWDTTDNTGSVCFRKLSYSVFSYIFHHYSKTLIYASNGCYVSDTLQPCFHLLHNNETLILKMHPNFIPLDFKVVDKDDKQPIPGARVHIISVLSGKVYTSDTISGADGRVVFAKMPKCGSASVIAVAEGYFPDSLINKSADELAGDINSKRTLSLKPVRKPITFYIVDCNTGQPLAGVHVQIDINVPGKIIQPPSTTTNINGVGKYVYDQAHEIAKIHITGSKPPFYFNGELPYDPIVKDFITFDSAKRTFCLKPNPHPVTFKNVDSCSGKPLEGVISTVTIKNASGEKTVNIPSNSNGIIPISVMDEDIVTIISKYPPDYDDNSTKIVSAKGKDLIKALVADRTIPLHPKEVDIKFRTVDNVANGPFVPSAQLDIRVQGSCGNLITPKESDKNGEFVIVKVPKTAKLFITASKQDYGINNSTINGQTAQELFDATPDKRDIPLTKIPSTPPPSKTPPVKVGCHTENKAGNDNPSVEPYNMLNDALEFDVEYNMYSEPDQIIIYCGSNTYGKVLYDSKNEPASKSDGKIAGKHIAHINMKDCGNSTNITIEIIPGKSTSWDYKIVCP